MFIGRVMELEQLEHALSCNQRAVMIYGKRRIGKTTLIRKALMNSMVPFVYYECVKGSMQENIDGFVNELVRAKVLTVFLNFVSFRDVFTYLNNNVTDLIIVIDEYPYLKYMTAAETVDSVFQSIIDNSLSNLRMVLSGSHIGMMKDLLREGNALYGRFYEMICLNELNYRDASGFYPGVPPYEKIAFYSVFGGSPFINQAIDSSRTLRENIIRMVLNPSSAVYLYASQLLLSDYSIRMNAERIFDTLGNGRKRYSDIENRLDVKRTGNLSKQIKSLMELEIIHKNEPINKIGDSKKATFEINDNLLRFYFTYIYKNGSALQMLGPETFYDQYIAPTVTTFISKRFEDICRSYFSLQARAGKLNGVRNIGTYYYDDAKHRRNGEFDIAIEYQDDFELYEAKYYQKPMELDEIHREVGQIREISELQIRRIGFIAANGFATKEDGYNYLTGEELYATNV